MFIRLAKLRKRHFVSITESAPKARKNRGLSPMNKRASLKFGGRTRSQSRDVPAQRGPGWFHHRR